MLTKLGKYEIKSELGQGAMGVVYLAYDANLGRPAALKVMSPNLARDPDLLKRFYREAISAGKLGHPNIVTIYDIDEEDGVPYIAMEFLEGETLRQLIQEQRELSTVRKLDIITQACKGLHFAHQNGVIHRDVKPSNILVLKNGQVKILDFGIAHVEDASLTQPGIIIGTPFYMAPEQVRGERVDGRSDIFSLGVILYELFALTNPFAGRDLPSVLNRICHVTPEPLSQLMPDCPQELDRIIQKATTKSREERYQNAEDLFFDLLHLGGSLKRSAVEEQFQQGQRLFQEGNLALAEESLRKALAIDSSHNLARTMLREVQETIKGRQRAERVLQILNRAAVAAEARRHEECLNLAAEAIRLDPANEQARRYQRESSERLARERSIREHLMKAEGGLRNGDLETAEKKLSEVLKLDPEDAEALELAKVVAQESARRQRAREAQELLTSAQVLLAAGESRRASEALDRATELEADGGQVETVRARIREQAAQDEAPQIEAARREAINEARLLIERGSYSDAIYQLEQTVASTGESDELTALLNLASHEERKSQKLQRERQELLHSERELERSEASGATALDFDLVAHEPASSGADQLLRSSSALGSLVELPSEPPLSRESATPPISALSNMHGHRARTLLIAGAALLVLVALIWSLARGPSSAPQPSTAAAPTAPVPSPTAAPGGPPATPAPGPALPVQKDRPKPLKKKIAAAPSSAAPRVPAGKPTTPPEFGQLTITSDISGAKIVLDGISDPSWVTPFTFPKVQAGKRHVRLIGPDRKVADDDVEVAAGQSTPFNLPFPPPRGHISVTTQPPGLEVSLDGQSLGPSPIDKWVNAGHHDVTVQLPCGIRHWPISLPENGNGNHDFACSNAQVNAAAATGTVQIRTTPAGATIFVDKKWFGTGSKTLTLPVGHHEVMLSFPGCLPVTQSIEVPAGGSAPAIDKPLDCK